MILIIPNIPLDTSEKQIRNFLEALNNQKFKFFRINLSKYTVSIKCFKNSQTDKIEKHALLYVDTDKLGKQIIKLANKKILLSKPVYVREYITRSYHNDRREKPIFKDSVGRRKSDRRRGKILEEFHEYFTPTFSSKDEFARKYLS